MSSPSTLNIQVPAAYPAVMAVGLSSVLLTFFQGMMSAQYYRRRAGVPYPAVFASDASIEAEHQQRLSASRSSAASKATSTSAPPPAPAPAPGPGPKAQFNCAQRAHANTLETLPGFLLCLFVAGLGNAKLAAALGGVWVIGRIWFTLAYASGEPKRRFYPFLSTFVAYIGLIGTAGHTIYTLSTQSA